MWPAYDTLSMSRWLPLKGCSTCISMKWGTALCATRLRKDDILRSEQTSLLPCHPIYKQKYKKYKSTTNSKYNNTEIHPEKWTNLTLTIHRNTKVCTKMKEIICLENTEKNGNTSSLVTMYKMKYYENEKDRKYKNTQIKRCKIWNTNDHLEKWTNVFHGLSC